MTIKMMKGLGMNNSRDAFIGNNIPVSRKQKKINTPHLFMLCLW